MAETVLVDRDIEAGRKLLAALDEGGIPLDAAYWLYRLESGRWKLVLASPLAASAGALGLYQHVQELLGGGVAPGLTLGDISVVSPRDPVASGLHRLPGVDRVAEFRLTDGVVNGLSVDDAYVYRTRPNPVAATT